MLKEYLKENNISVYRLSKDSGVPYTTLNELVNGKVSVENVSAGLLRNVSRTLSLSMDELYDLCLTFNAVEIPDIGKVDIAVRSKTFALYFTYNDLPVELELCKVTEASKFFLNDLVRWRVERYVMDQRMEAYHWNTI